MKLWDRFIDSLFPPGVREKPTKKRSSGLNWVGRTEDGVSIYEGTWNGLPKWFCNLFKGLGIGLFSLGCLFWIIGIGQPVKPLLTVGLIHSLVGFVLMERWRTRMDMMLSESEAASQLGITQDELRATVKQEGIKPAYILNDEPKFALESFGDAGLLLRASHRPEEEDLALLRPATGGAPANSHQLLRPLGLDEGISQSKKLKDELHEDQVLIM